MVRIVCIAVVLVSVQQVPWSSRQNPVSIAFDVQTLSSH